MTYNTTNTNTHNVSSTRSENHPWSRYSRSGAIALLVSTAALAACGSSGKTTTAPPTSTPVVETTQPVVVTPTTTITPVTTTVAPAEPFHSALYQYMVTSLDWRGRSASTAWDGTGSPGNGDPTVDFLYGPNNVQAYAFGGPTTLTLDEFVAAGRVANAVAHSCPVVPDSTASITIGGEPAIVDEVDCGVFAISGTVIHAGRVYAFFTFDQPGKEDEMRAWFGSLLQLVAFAA